MKIEVLYPEICNLYGDLANIRYLKECLAQAEVIETTLQTRPRFLEEEMDLVYMGSTTENGQRLALDQLRFFREEILAAVEKGQKFLITGNAMEIFGDRIEEDGEMVLRGLGVFPGVAKRSSINRFNSLFLGDFTPEAGEPIRVAGFKSQFGHTFCDEGDQGLDDQALFTAVRGPGMNRYAKGEGIHRNNFLATYVIGPLLILNPPFTRWFIEEFLGEETAHLAYEKEALASYEARVKEYADPNTGLYYWGGTTERW